MPHVTFEEICSYWDQTLTEDQECAVEEHLAQCASCREEAHRIKSKLALLEGWNRDSHRRAYFQATLAEGLDWLAARRSLPEWKPRLARWREQIGRRSGRVVQLFLAKANEPFRLSAEEIDATPAEPEWSYSLEPVPPREELVLLYAQVSPMPPPARPRALFSFEPKAGLNIQVDGWPVERSAPLVLLLSTTIETPPRLQEMKKREPLPGMHTQFTGVEAANYLVAWEPAPLAA